MSSSDDTLGVCRTADDLRHILRARFEALGVSLDTVDHIAGLPTRYTAKVLGLQPTKGFGQISFDALLGAAGVMLIAVEDVQALDRVRARLLPLQRVDCGPATMRTVHIKLTRDFMAKIGEIGRRKQRANRIRKKHRAEINRRNALKRWR